MNTAAQQAIALLQQGRVQEAEQAFERVLASEPAHLQALNVLALGALRDGRTAHALELAGRAVAAAPADAMSHHHLAQARLAQGDSAGAIENWREAVRLRPDFHVARLHLGTALQRAGDETGAVVQLARALQDAQRAGRWIDARSTPAALRPQIEQAVATVRRGSRAAFERVLEPLTAEYGAAALQRVRDGLAIYLNERPPVYPDPRQQPTFFYVPGLPTMPYIDASQLPWVPAFEACYPAIRAELEQVLPATHQAERVFHTDALERANLRGTRGADPGWTGFYFYRHGERREDNCRSCPRTAAALDELPLCRIRGHGPEVLFSVYTPGTHLPGHRGVTNTRLTSHLPPIVPEDCALDVGGELHEWKEGRVVVFDDSYEHESWNRSDEVRVVLIYDIWNPYLTPEERAAVGRLVEEIGEFRHATEAA
ncbi:MAG: aspartyl/asparaginyl beta-hydroxylase domain-containing protein [Steroidobacteraceae bacterium]